MMIMLSSEIKMSLMLGIMFSMNSHPISLIILLIFLALMCAFLMLNMTKNSWLSMIFILIILGGMLILFIYIASLASNEPFPKSTNFLMPLIILMIYPLNMKFWNSSFSDKELFPIFMTNISYNNTIAILYLLMTLLTVMEIISCYKNPLRSSK